MIQLVKCKEYRRVSQKITYLFVTGALELWKAQKCEV